MQDSATHAPCEVEKGDLSMSQKLAKGQMYGRWKLVRFLGEGGNGAVWLARTVDGEEAALKFLTKLVGRSKKVYARFIQEVSTVEGNKDIDGVLPIIDRYLPASISNDVAWYAMPVAQPLLDYLSGKTFEAAVQATIEVGNALVRLHERGISHRDIKPANMLVRNDKVYLTDFGLARTPSGPDITSTGEQIGAKWTIAPEMKRQSTIAEGMPADVYSLAKTLWILITGQKQGFDGQYDPESVNGLREFHLMEPNDIGIEPLRPSTIYSKPLDDLLKASTNDDPQRRPDMRSFVADLSEWLATYKAFRRRNPLQWQDVQTGLFPIGLPSRAVWEDIGTIVQILDYLGSINSLNHMMLPEQGGMDLIGARIGREPHTVELIVDDKIIYLVRPVRLVFESFGFDWEWNYFLLETGGLESTGIDDGESVKETLVEISPLRYLTRDGWYDLLDESIDASLEARFVTRFLKGSFLIVQKTSTYNGIPSTYDGRHSRMGTDEFREYMAGKVELLRRWRSDDDLRGKQWRQASVSRK